MFALKAQGPDAATDHRGLAILLRSNNLKQTALRGVGPREVQRIQLADVALAVGQRGDVMQTGLVAEEFFASLCLVVGQQRIVGIGDLTHLADNQVVARADGDADRRVQFDLG